MTSTGSRTNRTLALIVLAWAGTAGLTIAQRWDATAWIAVVTWGLAAWIGGKGWAAWVEKGGKP